MTQQLVIYGPTANPTVYATGYDTEELEQQFKHCVARHGVDTRVRVIEADKLPPSRIN